MIEKFCFREMLERKREKWYMVILISETPIGGGVYRCDRNTETKPTVALEVDFQLLVTKSC